MARADVHCNETLALTKQPCDLELRSLGPNSRRHDFTTSPPSSGSSLVVHCLDPPAQRNLPPSPLAPASPMLAAQQSTATSSTASFRSPSALDGIPTNLLRRYPRFSTATTSIDTGRPNFSVDELTSTQLSDDEDSILNDDPDPAPRSSTSLMKHRLARDVRAVWSAQASRFRYARRRIRYSPASFTGPTLAQTALGPPELAVSEVKVERRDVAVSLNTQTQTQTCGIQEADETGVMSTPSLPYLSRSDEVDDMPESTRGETIASMIRAGIRKDSAEGARVPKPGCRQPAPRESSLKVVEDRALAIRPSAQLTSLKARGLADLHAMKQGSLWPDPGYYRYASILSTRRASLSHMGRSSRPSSRPGTSDERGTLSSSVTQQPAKGLFIDTPNDPGTSFMFPVGKGADTVTGLEESRPCSHAGSVLSLPTAIPASVDDVLAHVEFGKAMPAGYEKVPAYTIRRIERSESNGRDLANLAALPDSPVAFEEPKLVLNGICAGQEKESVSRASKWSTKVQTSPDELEDQAELMDDRASEEKRDNFALRSCHKIARALSGRMEGNSLPARFKTRRWKRSEVKGVWTEAGPSESTCLQRSGETRNKRFRSGRNVR